MTDREAMQQALDALETDVSLMYDTLKMVGIGLAQGVIKSPDIEKLYSDGPQRVPMVSMVGDAFQRGALAKKNIATLTALSAQDRSPPAEQWINEAIDRVLILRDAVEKTMRPRAQVPKEDLAAIGTAEWSLLAHLRARPDRSPPVAPLAQNFTPFYLLSNARRLSRCHGRMANVSLAMQLFAVGHTTANRICHEAGIDPEAFEVQKVGPANQSKQSS